MTAAFHVAVDHLEDGAEESTTTYLGTCDQAHVDKVRAIAALEDSPRFVRDHPRLEGAFMVLRDDGDLDVYVPTDAAEYRVYEPDPAPRKAVVTNGGDEDVDRVTIKPGEAIPVFTSTGTQTGELADTLPNPSDIIGRTVGSGDRAGTITGTGYDGPRGGSGPAYISGVTKFGRQSIGGAMDTPGNPPRIVWHTTESPAGASYFTSVSAYLIRVGAEPQVIYCPVTDKLGQFGPLTKSGRALKNDGSRRTNREGKVCIQVEVLGRAASPWTKGFDPAKKPNFRKLLAAARAHGVPDVWPAGAPKATAAQVAKGPRSRATWQNKGGHYGHGHVPANSHWDPGAIDTSIVPGKASSSPSKPPTTPSKPAYEPFPGTAFFHGGRHSTVITAMGRRLEAEGCGAYRTGPGPNWTNADRESYRRWQTKLGYTGSDADGYPGKTSWDKLRVPNT